MPAARPPSSVQQFFLPAALSLEEAMRSAVETSRWDVATLPGEGSFSLVYQPALLAQAVVRYQSARASLNADRRFTFLVRPPLADVPPHWAKHAVQPVELAALERAPSASGRLGAEIPGLLADPKRLAAWQKDLVTYLYRAADFTLHQNTALKLFARAGQSYEEFRQACQRAAEAGRDDELQKLRARYDRKLDRLEDQLAAERRELGQDQQQLQARETESRWTTVESLLGLALGYGPRRILTAPSEKRRLAQKARHDVDESRQVIAGLEAQIAAVKVEAQQSFQSVKDRWNASAQDIHPLRLTPRRSDILVEIFGLGWLPHWQTEAGGQLVDLPAYPLWNAEVGTQHAE